MACDSAQRDEGFRGARILMKLPRRASTQVIGMPDDSLKAWQLGVGVDCPPIPSPKGVMDKIGERVGQVRGTGKSGKPGNLILVISASWTKSGR